MEMKFFDLAFEQANLAFYENEVPVGAVIVSNGEVLAISHNKKESDSCCISHAEILAIQIASKKLNNWRLDNCDIYVTLDPCPMCASAIKQSRIKNVYSALNNSDFLSTKIIKEIFNADLVNPEVNFSSNLAVDKSKKILKDFFEKQRNR